MPISGTKYVRYLVADTSAFINHVQLQNYGENIITIPEVIAEIRNKRQYRHLFSLTHDVELKDVFSESINFVTEFAKKTGDFISLSATDIKLIALTYQLEVENVGHDHLKKEPVLTRYNVNKQTLEIGKHGESDDDDDGNSDHKDENETEEQELQEEFDSDGDDEEGWVTPDNIEEVRRNFNKINVEETQVTVGCLSTDFAIQNVLMQIGLNVVTVDGKIIRELRSYILRCYACFKTTTNMKKMFCPNCGNKTLKRVSVFIDKEGNKKMFINFKKPLSTRGKRFSLPLPQGGKHAVNPRLVEDARRPHQKPSRLARTKTDALQPDYIAGNYPFVMRDIHSKSAQLGFNQGKYVFKNWMRRNPNESKRNPKK